MCTHIWYRKTRMKQKRIGKEKKADLCPKHARNIFSIMHVEYLYINIYNPALYLHVYLFINFDIFLSGS
jgi:hypothetical protein